MVSFQELGLVNTKELFRKAYDGGYAVPAFNFVFTEQLQAIIDACLELQSPVIIQASAHTCENMGIEYVRHLVSASMERVAAKNSPIQVALNLDHGLRFEDCKRCIENGFSSVMIDGSAKEFSENIAISRQVVELAHPHHVCVEGELGILSGKEGEVSHSESKYTDPKAVKEFVEASGVDSLAISIGSCHGVVKIVADEDGSFPPLRFDILKEIEESLPGFPIVLHGSSCIYPEYVEMINRHGGHLTAAQGIPEEQVKRAAESAVCKINVASDGWIAATAAARKALWENPETIDPRTFLKASRAEMTRLYIRKIQQVMGSAGKC